MVNGVAFVDVEYDIDRPHVLTRVEDIVLEEK